MHDLLVRFDDAQAAVEEATGWVGWEETIAHLGFRDLAPRVAAARARRAHHRRDQRRRLVQGGAAQGRDASRTTAIASAPISTATLDDPIEAPRLDRGGAGEPQRNPLKDVGRNDPCPCGSGKKFKKCCLGKVEAEGPWMPPGSLLG